MRIIKPKKNTSNSIKLKSPWKKVLLLAIFMVIIIVAIEFAGNYFQYTSLKDININEIISNINLSPELLSRFSPAQYMIYGSATLILVLLIIILIAISKHKRHKNNTPIEKKQENNISDKDIKKTFQVMDSLLEKLPEKEIEKFSKSKDAELYKKVLKKYGVK